MQVAAAIASPLHAKRPSTFTRVPRPRGPSPESPDRCSQTSPTKLSSRKREVDPIRIELARSQARCARYVGRGERAGERSVRREQARGVVDLGKHHRQDVRVGGACAHVALERQVAACRCVRCAPAARSHRERCRERLHAERELDAFGRRGRRQTACAQVQRLGLGARRTVDDRRIDDAHARIALPYAARCAVRAHTAFDATGVLRLLAARRQHERQRDLIASDRRVPGAAAQPLALARIRGRRSRRGTGSRAPLPRGKP